MYHKFTTEEKDEIVAMAKQILDMDLDRHIGTLEDKGKITINITIERKKDTAIVEHDLSRSSKKIKIFR